jgi:5-methyltetrahydrofolate--homocysteine methyltransferase
MAYMRHIVKNDTIYINSDRTIDFPFLRQQAKNAKNEYYCLSDFVAPKSADITDYVGAFAVTAGLNAEQQLKTVRTREMSIVPC